MAVLNLIVHFSKNQFKKEDTDASLSFSFRTNLWYSEKLFKINN